MGNKVYQVEIDLKAKVNILADSEEAAHIEAANVAEDVRSAASKAGLYMEVRDVKPRQLISTREVP